MEPTAEQLALWRQQGRTYREIALEIGCSETTVRNRIKAAGLFPDTLPEFTIAKPRKPHIFPVTIAGKRYIDITDLYIPM